MIDSLVNIGKLIVLLTTGAAVSVYVILLIKGVQSAATAVGGW